MKKGEESTYALLSAAQEKEKGHDLFETGVYTVFILTTVLAIWQFAAVAKPLPKAIGASLHHHVHKAHFTTAPRPS
jgi:hypothetical protein